MVSAQKHFFWIPEKEGALSAVRVWCKFWVCQGTTSCSRRHLIK